MSRKSLILLLLILSLGAFLRLYRLGEIPDRLRSDEAAFGYNAYSVLKTGKDEFGEKFPLAFKSFGEYKAPLLVYLLVPVIWKLDLTVFATRLPSALFGIATILVVYLLAHEVWNRAGKALLAALVLAILPWHLQFTRIAYEGSIAGLLIALAVLFFIKRSHKHGWNTVLSLVFFGLAFYSHLGVRLFIPLLLGILMVIYRRHLFKYWRFTVLGFAAGAGVLVPLTPILLGEAGIIRAKYLNLATDTGVMLSVNEKRAEHNWQKTEAGFFVLHNKVVETVQRFLTNYSSHFDVTFLTQKGDDDGLFSTPFSGPLPLVLVIPLAVGLIALFKSGHREAKVILAWLFLSPIPSAMTRLSASTNRIFIMTIPLAIIIGGGLGILIRKIRLKLILVVLLGLFFLEYLVYLDGYYTHADVKIDRDGRLGRQEIILPLANISTKYSTIWITNKAGGYIHLLFYLKYPPHQFQKQVSISDYDEFGFVHVTSFDKFIFQSIPKYFDYTKDILYLAEANQIPKGVNPLFNSNYKDGQPAFVMFDTAGIKTSCISCSIEYKPKDEDIYGHKIAL